MDDPYEEPLHPELILHTDKETIEESAQRVVQELEKRGYIQTPRATAKQSRQ